MVFVADIVPLRQHNLSCRAGALDFIAPKVIRAARSTAAVCSFDSARCRGRQRDRRRTTERESTQTGEVGESRCSCEGPALPAMPHANPSTAQERLHSFLYVAVHSEASRWLYVHGRG